METAAERILRFPVERVARPAIVGASRSQVWWHRLRECFGRILSRIGVPGQIAECEIEDAVTGKQLSIGVGALYVRLSIDGRDYYFDRFSGRFNGTGCRI
jgi:hypothetical protein